MPDASLRSPWLRLLLRIALTRPGRVLAAWALLLAVFLSGGVRLDIDTSTASFLDRSGPDWRRYQASLERFGGDEFLVVAIPTRGTDDVEALARSLELARALEALPGVRRVDSLASVPLIRLDEAGDLDVSPGLASGIPEEETRLRQLQASWRSDRIAPRSLISGDEGVLSLNVILDADIDGDRARTVERATQLVAESGDEGWVTGVPVFRTAVNSRTRSEVLLFVPVTLVVVALVLCGLLRGLVGIGIALSVGAVGSAAALGAMGALGVALSLSTMVLPSILLGLGCAYAMHVLTAARGTRGPAELGIALEPVARPVALSGLTTALGFLAMATVPIAAIRDLATFGAVGVFVSTAATLTLAPALLAVRPIPGAARPLERWLRSSGSRRIAQWSTTRARGIAVAWLALALVVGVGIVRLQVSTDIILWFPVGSEVRDDYETVRTRLSGITPVNVVIEARGAGRSVTESAVAAAVDRLRGELEELPQVGRALAYTDPIRQIHSVGKGVPDAPLRLSRAAIEQYLLLLSGVDQMDDVIGQQYQAANILLRVDDNSSHEIVDLADWVADWWREHGVAGFDAETTGIMYEFGRAEEAIAYGQIQGLGLALAAITLILFGVFRSTRSAALALVANGLPLAIAFGAMGLLGIRLDAATVCMGSVALGIAVDDTIHILEGVRAAELEGADPARALTETFARVLPALVFTTLCIGAGFAVLALSDFSLILNLGVVTASVVVLCLLADLTLLPALLCLGRRA